MENRPPYAIASVDYALLLATALQQEGPMRVTDVAGRLGVSASTAHRLLRMLVYRDFAEQLPDRRYGPGPLMRRDDLEQEAIARVRTIALRRLRRLVDEVDETANLMILDGTDVRFVATVECGQVLRVGDRTGRSMPARLISGGKALLAASPPGVVDRALGGVDATQAARMRRELSLVRRRGYAVNDQESEAGLTAVGVLVPPAEGVVRSAISLSMPSVRWSRALLPERHAALAATAAAIAQDLAGE